MKYLLHSSIYRQPLQANPCPVALQRWNEVGWDATAISVLTEAEILASLYLEANEQRFHYFQNTIRDRVRILPVDDVVARLYARLKARSHATDPLIPDAELIVAATAKAYGLTLAILDRSDLPQAWDVDFEEWGLPSSVADTHPEELVAP